MVDWFGNRSLRSELAAHKRLVSRYAKYIDEQHPMYEVVAWEQVSNILNTKGDTREVATIRARVLRPDLQLIRLVFGCGWRQPAKYRRRVKLAVRNLHVGNVLGTSLEVTHSWLHDGKFDVIVHVPTPPRVGSDIRFLVVMDWPKKSAPLMAREPEDFVFRFVRQNVNYANYRIMLPPGCDAYHTPVGFDDDDDDFKVQPMTSEDGRRHYLFEAFDLPVMHRAGITLELTGKDTRALRELTTSIATPQH